MGDIFCGEATCFVIERKALLEHVCHSSEAWQRLARQRLSMDHCTSNTRLVPRNSPSTHPQPATDMRKNRIAHA